MPRLRKVAVEEDIAGGGLHADVVHDRLDELEIAADGGGVEAAGAAGANQRAADALDHQVAVNVLQGEVGGDGIKGHVAMNAVDGDVAGVGADLQLGFGGHGDFVIGA